MVSLSLPPVSTGIDMADTGDQPLLSPRNLPAVQPVSASANSNNNSATRTDLSRRVLGSAVERSWRERELE